MKLTYKFESLSVWFAFVGSNDNNYDNRLWLLIIFKFQLVL